MESIVGEKGCSLKSFSDTGTQLITACNSSNDELSYVLDIKFEKVLIFSDANEIKIGNE